MLYCNKALWLAVENHMTSFSQLECFISALKPKVSDKLFIGCRRIFTVCRTTKIADDLRNTSKNKTHCHGT